MPHNPRWRQWRLYSGSSRNIHGAQDGDTGIGAFLSRADELAAAYGDRFAPTPWLRDLAASGGSFPA